MTELRFDDQVVVVTGAGSGLGQAYAVFFASRGASVVANDFGSSVNGEGTKPNAADAVVQKIVAAGGRAVASYDNVKHGDKIIETAISAFGRVDILINNAGILRDVSFKNITDHDWDLVNGVHLKGAYKCTHAAWSHFRKQGYGRIILTSSAAGLYGNFGQTSFSAAKMAMVGFGETLAKEGAKYNILCNIIAPVAASRMTAAVMPPDVLQLLKPELVVPLVAVLVHPTNNSENGSIFEVGGGHASKLRWERARGAILKCDDSLTPGAVLGKWNDINDFSKPDHPKTTADMVANLERSKKLKINHIGPKVGFDGRVAIVTGGGAGLGRAYCLQLAKLGASVVVNDLANPDFVVEEIRSFGGTAVGNKASVEDGEAVIKTAINSFGRVDILINNAGILRDKAFTNMNEKLWDDIYNVHLRGTYKCTKAAYPYMLKQKYGRIVNTTSTSGIYGNYGQTNYAAAKTGIIGFSKALAIEGRKNNIIVNCIAPSAGTQLTRTVLSEELVNARKPDYVAPLVLLLSSDKIPDGSSGQIFEVGCGWQGRTRWQRSGGHNFPLGLVLTPEEVLRHWKTIVNFEDGRADNPESTADSRKRILESIQIDTGTKPTLGAGGDYIKAIEEFKMAIPLGTPFNYTDRDCILYNISLGADRTQLHLVYERDSSFQVLPTFGVIPGTGAPKPFKYEEIIPNFSYEMLLHGEQYLEIRKFPIPTSGEVLSYPRLIEVLDKGKAAAITIGTLIQDTKTREDLFYHESVLFVRGSGGFGGPRSGSNRGRASVTYSVPDRWPDTIVEEETSKSQAILYRLNGDLNPLHIDPKASSTAGFSTPILHGLCSFGISAKHIVARYGVFKNIKMRFTGVVIPGQTIVTEMWNEGTVVIFQTRVKETQKLCMSGGGAELRGPTKPAL